MYLDPRLPAADPHSRYQPAHHNEDPDHLNFHQVYSTSGHTALSTTSHNVLDTSAMTSLFLPWDPTLKASKLKLAALEAQSRTSRQAHMSCAHCLMVCPCLRMVTMTTSRSIVLTF